MIREDYFFKKGKNALKTTSLSVFCKPCESLKKNEQDFPESSTERLIKVEDWVTFEIFLTYGKEIGFSCLEVLKTLLLFFFSKKKYQEKNIREARK